MGRVRALAALRDERASMIRRQGTAALELEAGTTSGKRVIEAKGLEKRFADKVIVKGFDLRVLRGDRVAFVGPNGVGKTTLLKMLVGEVARRNNLRLEPARVNETMQGVPFQLRRESK